MYSSSQSHFLVALIVVPEIKAGSGEGGVHDDEVGEGVGRVLHHAETREAAPVLADQRDLLQVQVIQEFPQDEAVELVCVVLRAGVLVRLTKPCNQSVSFILSLEPDTYQLRVTYTGCPKKNRD